MKQCFTKKRCKYISLKDVFKEFNVNDTEK